jgi:crotonobetainyl-CoA:carnitine CoA-transferase CaiB-like acyl-CoA transferase
MRDSVDHPDRPGMQVLANPIRINGQRLPNRPAPLLGADTDVILTDLGIGADELAALKLAGIV